GDARPPTESGRMSAIERVRQARVALAAGAVAKSLLWGGVTVALVIATTALLDWSLGLPRALREPAGGLAVAAGIGVALVHARRSRRTFELPAVGLWLEEQQPELRYALVTLLERGDSTALQREVASVRWGSSVRRALVRAVMPPLIVLAATLAIVAIVPPGVLARVRDPRVGDTLEHATARPGARTSRLTPLVATVRPPAYAGGREQVIEDPSSIHALAGSSLELEGPGESAGLVARVGHQAIAIVPSAGDRWRIALSMPPRSAVLRLADGAHQRLVILESRPDSAPVVTLTLPTRDTVLRTPGGSLMLAAEARDDIALKAVWFEYIVSSGQGESFDFRSGTVGRASAGGRRAASVRAPLPLESLSLGPGDVVHMRAVARDVNSVTGPGVGSSETRVVRVARLGEYDSVAVEGAPPPEVDKSEISQRMLIMLAEALVRRQPRLRRDTVVAESRRIGSDQARLRRRVGEIVFIRLTEASAEHSHAPGDGHDHGDGGGELSPEELLRAAEEATSQGVGEALDFEEGESPVVAINRPLLEAYNAMWDAGRELDIGQPARALPHMRAALAAIQRAREAERIYLRGRPPAVTVDVERARLAGNIDSARAAPRGRRRALEDAALRNARRLDRVFLLLGNDPGAAIDSLMVIRVDLLDTAPAAAAALGDAVDRLRTGREATDALVAARRRLVGEPEPSPALSAWDGAW
ncbi:MAG TPA: hypothetical protein VJ596_09175, partial [Gemmatimonadaceae bacterium]|nr:hypothetical protein [Gemmatimonadaceae bacterium]